MKSLLSHIHSPSDLKSLSIEELTLLAEEIRHKIIDVLSTTGGHLASNLGIVELSIALHYVFSSPDDPFIFDVSHQSYPHKLLTGRGELFKKLRQFKGLCGFSNPKESCHDHFYAGHAGTALSLALGVATTRDLREEQFHVLPILGDASLTCGLTLEALNNIPKSLKNFIVILNDNNMSISQNVGAITHVLSRLVNHPNSNRLYRVIEKLLLKIPGLGKTLAKQGGKLKGSIKNLVSSAPFFEHFNLSYVGPVDGHDLTTLIPLLEKIKNNPQPIVLHVMTEKGRGMQTAIDNPTCYHGCKPFDKETGHFLKSSSSKPSFPQIFGRHLLKMAEQDPLLVAVTPAMPAGSCLEAFMERFPKRCLDVGIAEGHAVTFCGGLGSQGKAHVVSSIYATFFQRAFDNLFQDVCLQEIPVVFAVDRAGISGPDGSTHHGIYDIAFLNTMPNMVIAQPRNGHLLKELLSSSFDWKRPAAIRYPNAATEEPDLPVQKREMGKAEILVSGKEVAIIALGVMCHTALAVSEKLKEQGIFATVIDPVFVKPLDTDLFYEILSSHPYIVTIEEHSLSGGLGMILNRFILENGLTPTKVLNFGIPDTFVEHGSNNELLRELQLDADSIYLKILSEIPQEALSL